MKTRLEQLKTRFDTRTCTMQGRLLYKALEGFAEILDNAGPNETCDPDLVDVYMILCFKNGTTMQITGQLTDIKIHSELGGNVIQLNVVDRRAYVMPDSTFIFSLNDITSIQSLDVVQHHKRQEAKMQAELEAEESRQAAAKDALKAEGLDIETMEQTV